MLFHLLSRLVIPDFDFQCFDLHFQSVVLLHLAFEEPAGQCHLFGNALGGEQIDVLELVLALVKIPHLHKALVDQALRQ